MNRKQRPYNVHYRKYTEPARYGYGIWNKTQAGHSAITDYTTRRNTGCSHQYSRYPIGGHMTKAQAQRRARYLYGYVRTNEQGHT